MTTTHIDNINNTNPSFFIAEDKEVHGWYINNDTSPYMKTYLHHRLRGQLAYFNSKSSSEKDKFMKYQWTLIIGSALTPALVSLTTISFADADLQAFMRGAMYWITMIVSVVVSIMAGALKTFKYQENWASTRAVCEMINREKFLYEASVGDYADKNQRDGLFVERIEGLLAREQNQWLNAAVQSSNNSKSKDADNDGVPDEVDDDVKPNDKKLDLPIH